MNASITAAVAEQRTAEYISDAASRRLVQTARDARPHRASSRHATAQRLRRRPLTAFHRWLAAGQL
jgi:hypothetical protein